MTDEEKEKVGGRGKLPIFVLLFLIPCCHAEQYLTSSEGKGEGGRKAAEIQRGNARNYIVPIDWKERFQYWAAGVGLSSRDEWEGEEKVVGY